MFAVTQEARRRRQSRQSSAAPLQSYLRNSPSQGGRTESKVNSQKSTSARPAKLFLNNNHSPMSSAEAPTPAPEASTSKVPAPAPSPAAPAAAVNSSAPAPPTPTAAPTPVSAPPSAAAAAPSTAAPAATPAPAADAPAPAVAASAAPANPLDALSQAELRKKLDVVRRDLKGELEKKKRIDRDLVSLRCVAGERTICCREGSWPDSTPAGPLMEVAPSTRPGDNFREVQMDCLQVCSVLARGEPASSRRTWRRRLTARTRALCLPLPALPNFQDRRSALTNVPLRRRRWKPPSTPLKAPTSRTPSSPPPPQPATPTPSSATSSRGTTRTSKPLRREVIGSADAGSRRRGMGIGCSAGVRRRIKR